MGDMANFELESVIEMEHQRQRYHSGDMSGQEAFDRGFEDAGGGMSKFAGNFDDYYEDFSPDGVDQRLEKWFGSLGGNYLGVFHGEPHYPEYDSQPTDSQRLSSMLSKAFPADFVQNALKEFQDSAEHRGKFKDMVDVANYNLMLREKYPNAYKALDYVYRNTLKCFINPEGSILKLPKHVNPTCNICNQEMDGRSGKFGKFYFCSRRCDGQGTVSDAYWQNFLKSTEV